MADELSYSRRTPLTYKSAYQFAAAKVDSETLVDGPWLFTSVAASAAFLECQRYHACDSCYILACTRLCRNVRYVWLILGKERSSTERLLEIC